MGDALPQATVMDREGCLHWEAEQHEYLRSEVFEDLEPPDGVL